MAYFAQLASGTSSPLGRRKDDSPNRGRGWKDSPSKMLPNINQKLLPAKDKNNLYSMLVPEFIDAAEETDSGGRGLSAFTKSQNMDIDTQTNFNIIDYDMNKQGDTTTDGEGELPHELICTCSQDVRGKHA